MATKKQLRALLKSAGVPFKSKDTVLQLEDRWNEYKNGEADGDSEPAEVVETAPKKTGTKKASKKKATKKLPQPKGAKAILREHFEDVGFVEPETIDKLTKRLGVSKATILTALSDLKNVKYAGKAGPLNIEKGQDGVYRLAK